MATSDINSANNHSVVEFSGHSFFATQKYADFTGIEIFQIPNLSICGNENTVQTLRVVGKIVGKNFLSPFKATFGGFSGLGRSSVLQDITDLLRYLKEEKGVMRCEIKLPPMYLLNQFTRSQLEALIELGGEILYKDLNFHVDTESWTEQCLSKGNRKKLHQCRREHFTVRRLEMNEIKNLHDLLRTNRESLGAEISITYEQLIDSMTQFDSIYSAYGVFAGDVLIVGAITVLVVAESAYVHMWADNPDWRRFSPIVMLFEHLVKNSQDRGIKYLDLGTSSTQGDAIDGLVRFKQNLGAVVSDKCVVSIDLNRI